MRSPFGYTPGRSPLHLASPGVAVAFLGSFALIAFAFSSPAVLLADGIAIALCGLAAGARRAVSAALRLALPLMVLMIVVNGLVSHRGETVLLRGWELPVIGSTDVTLESLAAGGEIGMRVVVVILAFAVYSACVNPDRVLRALRPDRRPLGADGVAGRADGARSGSRPGGDARGGRASRPRGGAGRACGDGAAPARGLAGPRG